MFRKVVIAAVMIGVAAASIPTSALADGRYYHGYRGGYNHGYRGGPGIGAGIALGVLGGALVGGAIVNSQPRYVYEDDVVTCHRVRLHDDYGNTYFRRVCD